MHYCFSFLLLLVLLLSLPGGASADRKAPPLQPGISLAEAVALWGEPVRRVEMETKRIQIWHYSEDRSFTVQEGSIVSVSTGPLVDPGITASTSPTVSAEPKKQNETNDFLRVRPGDRNFDLSSALSEIGDGEAPPKGSNSRRDRRRK